MGTDFAAKVGNFYVVRVDGVLVQRGAIVENCDEAGIVRARQVQSVKACGWALKSSYQAGQDPSSFEGNFGIWD